MSDGLEERVEALEEFKEQVIADRNTYRSEVIQPALQELRQGRDDAREERAELRATVEILQRQLRELEAKQESLLGLAEGESGGPKKRAADLRMGLIRRAEARSGPNEGTAAMHYREVQNFFAENGHGEVKKPECYQAMKDAAEADGFKQIESGKTLNGTDVRAVVVDLANLPSSVEDVTSSNPTTGEGSGTAVNTDELGQELTSD